MTFLLFPLFFIHLLCELSLFFTRAVLQKLHFSFAMIFPFLFFLLVFCVWFVNQREHIATKMWLEKFTLNERQQKQLLLEKKNKYQELLQQQPTHRDVLLNLAVVSCQLNEKSDCENYWQKALQQDPNNPVFDAYRGWIQQQLQ